MAARIGGQWPGLLACGGCRHPVRTATMFQLIFSALSAINQLAVFAAGLACWGLGGLLVGNAIYWRLHAVRVQGEVVGVRRNGNCFNSVYRYTSAAGATIEATSLEGSSS